MQREFAYVGPDNPDRIRTNIMIINWETFWMALAGTYNPEGVVAPQLAARERSNRFGPS